MNTICDFVLTGEMPILIHADDIDASDDLKAWRTDPTNKKHSVPGDDRSPAWTWQCYLYKDEEHLIMPSENVMAAIRYGAKKVLTGKKQETFGRISQSGLLIPTAKCEFFGPNGKVPTTLLKEIHDLPFGDQANKVKKYGFELFKKRCPIGNSKHVRVRAKFEQWQVKGQIEILDDLITVERLTTILELSGKYSGLGDWRPSAPKSPGPYGRFTAKVTKAKAR